MTGGGVLNVLFAALIGSFSLGLVSCLPCAARVIMAIYGLHTLSLDANNERGRVAGL
jgi:hypothetical protein